MRRVVLGADVADASNKPRSDFGDDRRHALCLCRTARKSRSAQMAVARAEQGSTDRRRASAYAADTAPAAGHVVTPLTIAHLVARYGASWYSGRGYTKFAAVTLATAEIHSRQLLLRDAGRNKTDARLQ